MWLFGSGVGSIIVGPFSETFSRNPIYIGSLVLFIIFTIAAVLSLNIGAQIAFHFLVGIFASPLLVYRGGTILDLWNPLEKTWAFSVYAIPAFVSAALPLTSRLVADHLLFQGGPMLGPVIGSYTYLLSWRWTEWLILIMGGLSSLLAICFLPETHPGVIQSWKAAHLRSLKSDPRYVSRAEIVKITFLDRVKHALLRPFALGREAIVIAISIYLSIIWSVLFIFLDGYTSIFQQTYHLTQGLTNVLFVAIYIGVTLAVPLVA